MCARTIRVCEDGTGWDALHGWCGELDGTPYSVARQRGWVLRSTLPLSTSFSCFAFFARCLLNFFQVSDCADTGSGDRSPAKGMHAVRVQWTGCSGLRGVGTVQWARCVGWLAAGTSKCGVGRRRSPRLQVGCEILAIGVLLRVVLGEHGRRNEVDDVATSARCALLPHELARRLPDAWGEVGEALVDRLLVPSLLLVTQFGCRLNQGCQQLVVVLCILLGQPVERQRPRDAT